MNKEAWKLVWNPFERIAGTTALIIGLVGLLSSAVINYYSGWHYHGLLHFGPAPNPAFYAFLCEQLVVWLVPSVLFYLGGLLFSPSRIRIVDVFGTVAFSLLPLVLMNIYNCLPPLQSMLNIDATMSPLEMIEQPGFKLGAILSVVTIIFLIWALIWMFKALRVSCNLKGWRLWLVYLVGVFGGEIICRYLIRLTY